MPADCYAKVGVSDQNVNESPKISVGYTSPCNATGAHDLPESNPRIPDKLSLNVSRDLTTGDYVLDNSPIRTEPSHQRRLIELDDVCYPLLFGYGALDGLSAEVSALDPDRIVVV